MSLDAALRLGSTAPPEIVARALAAVEVKRLYAEAGASVALDKGEGGTRFEPVFESFQKIPRWSRDIIITEKLDGTNGVIHISEEGYVTAGSRNRWLYPPQCDNFGFAKWVGEHEAELREALGPGRHFGEWWGAGIQRRYDLRDKRFSLFNVHRWHDAQAVSEGRSLVIGEKSHPVPPLISVVPVIYYGPLSVAPFAVTDFGPDIFKGDPIDMALTALRACGSQAAPGYMNPEGIVIYHTASGTFFKKILKDDEKRKEQ